MYKPLRGTEKHTEALLHNVPYEGGMVEVDEGLVNFTLAQSLMLLTLRLEFFFFGNFSRFITASHQASRHKPQSLAGSIN